MPPLPADFIHARACKLKCEKILTRPEKEKSCKFLYNFQNEFTNYEKMGESYKDSPMAEAVGFEPTCPCGQLDFESLEGSVLP